MRKSLLLLLFAALFAGCNTNEPDNTTTPTENTVNTGDDKSDYVEQHVWNDTVSIVWNGASATLSALPDSITVTNENGYVTIHSLRKHVAYSVSGSGEGQLRFDSVTPKFQLIVGDWALTCKDGPALNNQCHKTLYLVLNGTATLADKSGYNTTTSNDEDQKGALFSEGQVIVTGNGTLNVTGNNKHAFASDDYVRVRSGNLVLNAKAYDGLHTNDGVIIDNGTLVITAVDEGINVDEGSFYMTGGSVTVTTSGTSAKGIKSQGPMTIEGGNILVTTPAREAEGIETKDVLTISGGTIKVVAYDDAINSGSHMYIKGGELTAISTGNDGLDANGNLYIQGGTIIACGTSSPECGIDANEEGGYSVYFTGGKLLAIGGKNSVPSSSESTQAYISTSVSVSAKNAIELTDGTTALASFTVPDEYTASSQGGWYVSEGGPGGGGPGGGGPGGGGPGGSGGGLLITCPELTSGNSYTLNYAGSTATVTAQTTGSSSGGGRGGW